MTTRCTTNFRGAWGTDAIIYKHCDGYPDGDNGMKRTLERFFEAVEDTWPDSRYGDPSYLAARFVRFLSLDSDDGLGVGITREDPADIEYRYVLECTDDSVRPRVEVQNP